MKIVQIGANWGYDNLTEYLQSNQIEPELALFVEPFSIHLEKLSECYSNYNNVHIENVAVRTSSMEDRDLEIFYCEEDGPGYAVASIDPNHIYKHCGQVQLYSFVVPSVTIKQLLDKYGLHKIDWLLLDVESLDADLVLDFPWSEYDIQRVDIEHLHLGSQGEQVIRTFEEHGYSFEGEGISSYDWKFIKSQYA